MNKLEAIVVGGTILAIGGAFVFEQRQEKRLNDEIISLDSEIQQLTDRISLLEKNHATAVQAPMPLPQDQFTELLRIRGDLGQIKQRLSL
jgi:shikimate kinase